MKNLQQSGFTLIEIMVVIVIISIMAAVVVPNIMDNPDKARIVRANQDIQQIASALNLFKLDNFSYPSTDQGIQSLVNNPGNLATGANWKKGGYLTKLPKDPWGNAYLYLSPGVHGTFDLYSLGADGAHGGEEAAADIGNWQ